MLPVLLGFSTLKVFLFGNIGMVQMFGWAVKLGINNRDQLRRERCIAADVFADRYLDSEVPTNKEQR